jgi:hypothetical protein
MNPSVLILGIVGAVCGALGWLVVGLYMARRQYARTAKNAGQAGAQGRGDAGTTRLRARCPGGPWWWIVVVDELRDRRSARSTSFFAPEFEAPAWRAPFVEWRAASEV